MATIAHASISENFVDSCGDNSNPHAALDGAAIALRSEVPTGSYWSISHTTELMHFSDGAENRLDRWECVIRCPGERQQVGSGRAPSDAVMDAISKRQGEKIAKLKYRQQCEWDQRNTGDRFE